MYIISKRNNLNINCKVTDQKFLIKNSTKNEIISESRFLKI